MLGTHGLWVYFNAIEVFFGKDPEKLYLSIEVPIRLQPIIYWMSYRGLHSWILPAVFVVIGFVLWYWQSRIGTGNFTRLLKRLRLW